MKIFSSTTIWWGILLTLLACSTSSENVPSIKPTQTKQISTTKPAEISQTPPTNLVCHFCEKQLQNDYWSIQTPYHKQHLHLCHQCKESVPTCDHCQSPSQKLTSVENKHICIGCLESHPKCNSCNKHILSKYAKFPNDQKIYCLACAQNKHRCDTCGLPLSQQYRLLPDQRKICSDCFQSSVVSESQLQAIINKAKNSLAELGFNFSAEVMIKVVSADKMTSLQKNYRVPFHQHRRTLGLFLAQGQRATIYIESMLPEDVCLGVITHELVHSWQWQEMSLEIDPSWIEGMADWAAYHALQENNFTKEAQDILQQQDVYGIGVRKVLAIEKEYGIDKVIPILLEKFGK